MQKNKLFAKSFEPEIFEDIQKANDDGNVGAVVILCMLSPIIIMAEAMAIAIARLIVIGMCILSAGAVTGIIALIWHLTHIVR